MHSVIVGGVVLLIVFAILAMATRSVCPRYLLALATLVTAISGLVTALAYLM